MLWPGEFHGLHSPWGHKQSDTLSDFHFLKKKENICYDKSWALLVAQLVKNPPAMQEILVGFLGQEDPLEKG